MCLIKDKLKHIKHFNSLFEQNLLESGSAKPEMVRSTPLTGAGEETFIEKRWKPRKEIIDWL